MAVIEGQNGHIYTGASGSEARSNAAHFSQVEDTSLVNGRTPDVSIQSDQENPATDAGDNGLVDLYEFLLTVTKRSVK